MWVSLLAVACIGVIGGTAGVASASGGTITVPAANPYVATYDATGANLSYVTVSGTGFPANTPMFIEQCDGTSPTAPGWDPTINCDLGSSPGSAMSDGSGAVSFSATDLNRRFRPFEGPSPQQNFNCLGPAQADPNNGLANYTNCQIRVASNLSAATPDEAYKTLQLPNPSAPAAPTAVKALSGSTTTSTGPLSVTFTLGSVHGSPVTNNTATCTSASPGAATPLSGSGATSPVTVLGATTAKTYTCKVTSTNALGTSPASALSAAVIEGTPAAPTAVVAKSGSTTTTTGPLVVSFTGGATNGSALTAPQYTATCTSSNGGLTKTGTGAASPVTVTGASTGKTYTCTVKAHNARGLSLASAVSGPVILGSPAPPATPTVTNGASGVLNVAFTLLTSAQANGSPLLSPKYTATCTSSNGGVTGSVSGDTSPISVTGLTAGKTYTCRVAGNNARGQGLNSPPSTAHVA